MAATPGASGVVPLFSYRSMSYTSGRTQGPPEAGFEHTLVLSTPCSWYCQRRPGVGTQGAALAEGALATTVADTTTSATAALTVRTIRPPRTAPAYVEPGCGACGARERAPPRGDEGEPGRGGGGRVCKDRPP